MRLLRAATATPGNRFVLGGFKHELRPWRGKWSPSRLLSSSSAVAPRSRQLERLRTEEFDLVVVGGGATGSGVALDAASRGLKVAMIERSDFGAGTSARSTKLLWAGSRYLVQALTRLVSPRFFRNPITAVKDFVAEFKMVLNCHRERTFLLSKQAHLTNWLPIAVPFDRWFIWPPPFGYYPAKKWWKHRDAWIRTN